MDDLSPEPPRARRPESELLAPYAATVDSWLLDDRKNWHKQRHTAVRVYVRLRDEEGYEGSYSTVQRYVRRRREEMAAEAEARDAQGFLQLDWAPGECQVDFGQADFRVRGVLTRGHYLTVSFPNSNVGLTQVFWGGGRRVRVPGAAQRLRVRRLRTARLSVHGSTHCRRNVLCAGSAD
jgi:hypothetical protein